MGTVVETTVTMWQDPGSNVTCYRETLVRLASLNVTIKIIKYVIMGNVQVNGNKPLLCLGSPQLYSVQPTQLYLVNVCKEMYYYLS